MNEEIEKFLNNEEYILVYRSNYDSARQVNQELIDYVKRLQQENQQLKEKISCLQGLITNKIMVSEGYESVLKDKFNELELKYIASTDSCNDLERRLKQSEEVIDEAIKYIKDKVRVIPFDENGEGGGLELVDYDIPELLEILQRYKGDNKW